MNNYCHRMEWWCCGIMVLWWYGLQSSFPGGVNNLHWLDIPLEGAGGGMGV